MKFLFVILLGMFISNKTVYAEKYEYLICDQNCEFQTLDEALTESQNKVDSEIYIYLQTGNYTISKDYNIDSILYLRSNDKQNLNSVTIDGNGHTITTQYGMMFDYFNELYLKNINFILNQNQNIQSSPTGLLFLNIVESFSYENGTLTNNSENTDINSYGIYNEILHETPSVLDTCTMRMNNIIVNNFSFGIANKQSVFDSIEELRIDIDGASSTTELQADKVQTCTDRYTNPTNLTITNSDLSKNTISITGLWMGTIDNTKLNSIELYDGAISNCTGINPQNTSHLILKDTNNYGTGQIQKYFIDDIENRTAVYNNSQNGKNLYLITDDTSIIELRMKKEEEKIQKEYKDTPLEEVFANIDSTELENCDFTVSDSTIAKVENGKLIFLKAGDVEITATNRVTNDTYTISYKLKEDSIITNPKTGRYIMLFITIIIAVSIIGIIVVNRKNAKGDE